MQDFRNFDEERKRRWERRMERHSRHGQVWTGIFILLIGLAALLRATVPDLPHWLFSWQTFLIGLGFFIGVRHRFKGATWFILILVGVALLITDFYPEIPIRRFIWPVALIVMGAFIILRPRRRHWHWGGDEKKNAGTNPTSSSLNEETYSQEDFVDATSVFGGTKKNIISKNFKGGDIVNIFGGTELNLTQADFTGTAVIELTVIFGGTKLIIPSNWVVQSEAISIFGGIEDKRNIQPVPDGPQKILRLEGTVIFGGIDIKSY
jgi:predicted membrane protein